MTSIHLNDIGKRFGPHWLFRNISLDIGQGERIALLGHNGSGKSTLLQIISGFIKPTSGNVVFTIDGIIISIEDKYKYFSYAAPYMELPEEFTAIEFLDFYIKHQALIDGITPSLLLEISFLTESKNKQIRLLSSGMKQRLKLACALLSSAQIALLDEPLTNLDDKGVEFYKNLINHYSAEKIIVICSNNIAEEIFCCKKEIRLDT